MVQSPVQESRRRVLSPAWPLWVVFAAYPLWWALGLAAFIWIIVAIPLALGLLARGKFRVPRGFGIWLFFLAWVLISTTQVEGGMGRWMAVAYRGALYIAATIWFLWLSSSDEDVVSPSRVVKFLTLLWGYAIIGGYVGVVAPTTTWVSPFASLLPESLLSDDWVRHLVLPSFGEPFELLGYPLTRPTAPFFWTNDWGSCVAILTPIMFASWKLDMSKAMRRLTKVLLVLSPVPIVSSLNRGMWLGLGVGLVYAFIRLMMRARVKAVAGFVLGAIVIGWVLVASGLVNVGADRIATPHSDKDRASLYRESWELTLEAPIFGHGSPQTPKLRPTLPAIGTHGQLWLVLVSQGIVGAVAYFGWFVWLALRSWRYKTDAGLWIHVALIVGLVLGIVYEQLPVELHLLMIAAALLVRPDRGWSRASSTREIRVNRAATSLSSPEPAVV